METSITEPTVAAAAAAIAPDAPARGPFPEGVAWTLFAHASESEDWSEGSYARVGTFRDFESLWACLEVVGTEALLSSMWFFMRDPYPPLWENALNIRGGSYCLRIGEASTRELMDRYMAAVVLGVAAVDPLNSIVGVTVSPKRQFHILKLWNTSARDFSSPSDVRSLSEVLNPNSIQYRRHVEQKM